MKKQIFTYVLFFLVNAILLNTILYFVFFKNPKPKASVKGSITGNLVDKFDFYKIHKKDYNLVFIGDSRTYTNINNYQIDTILKTNSFNMAMWANWFPTQYSFLQDFLPTVPDNTTLVFSFGYQNFSYCKINDTYPIDYYRAKEYMDWGFSLFELKPALYYNNNKILPLLPLSQTQIHTWFLEKMDNYFAVFNSKKEVQREKIQLQEEETKLQSTTLSNQNDAKKTKENPVKNNTIDQLKTFYKNNPEVTEVIEKKEKDTITSLEVFWKRGNYWRVEIDSVFFRSKQLKNLHEAKKGGNISKNDFVSDERYWKNFEGIIKLLKKNDKRLKIILNYVDEAPYTYWAGRGIFTNFINTKLKPYIASQGFTFITADVSDIPDGDYFDYNHMNSKGTVKYSERLAKILKEKIN